MRADVDDARAAPLSARGKYRTDAYDGGGGCLYRVQRARDALLHATRPDAGGVRGRR